MRLCGIGKKPMKTSNASVGSCTRQYGAWKVVEKAVKKNLVYLKSSISTGNTASVDFSLYS